LKMIAPNRKNRSRAVSTLIDISNSKFEKFMNGQKDVSCVRLHFPKDFAQWKAYYMMTSQAHEDGQTLRRIPPELDGAALQMKAEMSVMFYREELVTKTIRSHTDTIILTKLRNFGRLGCPTGMPLLHGNAVAPVEGPMANEWGNLLCAVLNLPPKLGSSPNQVQLPSQMANLENIK
jgi:hypothetical protein